MSRFGNLEFEYGPVPRPQSSVAAANDEARCQKEADTAFRRADFETALRWHARTLEFNPRSLPAWIGQCRALTELERFKEAGTWADKALELFPQCPELLASKAVALARSGQTDIALAFSDASLDRAPDSPYLWLARGDVLLARREKRVEHCFDRALQLAGGDWLIPWLAARIHAFWKQFAAALKFARHAGEWDAGQFVVWLVCGECQLHLGLANAAAASFRLALTLEPESRAAEAGLQAVEGQGFLSRLFARWFSR